MNEINKFNESTTLVDDPDLKAIMESHLYEEVMKHGHLSMKIRELIFIVTNVTQHTLKPLVRHVNEGLTVGLSPIEIKEAIYQCTAYIGLGKVEDALEVVNEVFEKQGIDLPLASQATVNQDTRFEKGFEVQCLPFGKEQIQSGHDHAPSELKHIQDYLSAHCFGDFYTRKGLDMQTRELITFVMIATLGGCENQLRAHINGNIAVGNTREQLIETITHCQPYIGFPRTLNAINMINEVTSK